jgi:hypothetical protein
MFSTHFKIIKYLFFTRKWQPFKKQKKGGGQYKKTLKYLKDIVTNNAGGDHEGLFSAYYGTNQGIYKILWIKHIYTYIII